ncbi:Uncharacterised protein [Serratia rubidaea]|uniref:Uncharacterized protein n=1 Tax=Serratia rubidaea TaxID=61652 RepID=A0A447QHU4_SERRU|nr:Uncharacterised protein [Serratia rubidaea]
MRLIRTVVGVLTEDHYLNVGQFGEAKGVKHVFLRRIDGFAGLTLIGNKGERVDKIGLLFLLANNVMPGEGSGH